MKKYNNLTLCVLAALANISPVSADEVCDKESQQCRQLPVLEKVSITATRSKVDTAKYAGSIGIIEGSKLTESSNIISTLGNIPGFENGAGSGRQIGSQYTIRGFGYQSENRVIVRQDGVARSPSLFSNHISNFRTDADLLKRVEVVKGASSILYGSGAIGGIVDMQTKSAKDMLQSGDNFGALVGMRYESNDMKSIRGALFGQAETAPVDFLLYAKKAEHGNIKLADGGTFKVDENGEEDGYSHIDNDENINTRYLSVGYEVTPEQRLSASVYDYDEDLTTVWQTVYHAKISEQSPIIGSLQQTDYNLDYSYNSDNHDWLDLTAKLYKSKAYYARGWDYTDDNAQRQTLTYRNQDERSGFNIKNLAQFELGSIEHTLLTGLEYKKREETALYVRNGVITEFGSMPAEYKDWGLYFHDSMAMAELTVNIAGRFDSFDRTVNLPGKSDYDDTNFSPRVSVSYQLTNELNLLFGYSETFRAPTPHETSSEGPLNPHYHYLPNPELQAETAKEFEGGLAYSKDAIFTNNDQLSAKFTYFDGQIDDMIDIERLEDLGKPEAASYFVQYRNVDNAKRDGYEFELSYLVNSFQFDATYEHLDVYDEKTKEKVNQGFADKLQLAVSFADYGLGLNLGLELDHWFKPDQNPETIVSRGVTYTYVDQDFTQLNASGSYQLPHLGLFNYARVKFGVRNLTDKKYINARNVNTTSRVGTGRNAYLDLEISF